MELKPGEKLGPYEILSRIGEGGMGQVWKARDTRLDRVVAIKTSAAKFSERFETEARAVAALNHPHICMLFDVGPDYLVMEYIEGSEIKGPLPLDLALKYAIQLVSALEAAHRKGITHRDLKPANILVTKSGVKVLDFGLAKIAAAPTASMDEALTRAALTQEGAILGTLQYMAPEQLQGKTVDARADIFSFGCVLCEMLTGKRAFDGANSASVIAAILERPSPSITEVAPEQLDWALGLCLKKDPDERWQSVQDLRVQLERVRLPVQATIQTTGIPGRNWFAAASGLFALIAAGLAFVHFRETPKVEPVVISSIAFPENTIPGFLSFSPDGNRLAIRVSGGNGQQLYLRSLDSKQLRPVAGTDAVRAPFWSPDGRFIGFFASGKLKTVPAGGGPTQDLCDVAVEQGGTWNRDGLILYGTTPGPIMRVNASGGACTALTKPESSSRHGFPEFLPDGRAFLYVVSDPDGAKRGLWLASLDEPHGRRLIADLSAALYTPPLSGKGDGHLLFLRDRLLMAQPFDVDKLQTIGDPFAVAEKVAQSPDGTTAAASAAANGMLAYVSQQSQNSQLTWFDRSGRELGKVGTPRGRGGVSLAPDGTRVMVSAFGTGAGLFVRDLARDSEIQANTAGTYPGGGGIWSPDGNTVVFTNGSDLVSKSSSGGGPEAVVLHTDNPKFPADWSRDGHFLLYTEVDPKTQGDLWYVENPLAGGGGKPVRFLATETMESEGQFSPDGKWVAYTSGNGAADSVYVRPFPSGQWQGKISPGAASDPRWSPDGKEIFFRTGATGTGVLWAVAVHPGGDGTLKVDVPRKLIEYSGSVSQRQNNRWAYSVAPDGRFLVSVSEDPTPPTIQLISNWLRLATGATER